MKSLLAPTPSAQAELPELLPSTRSFLAKLETKGESTGELLFKNRPKVYQRVVAMLGQGHGSLYISQTLAEEGQPVALNTVTAVRRREGETVEVLKDRLARRNFEFADQADEAAQLLVVEIMSDPARRKRVTLRDVQSLKVSAGIAVTNGQLLSGAPTARLEVSDFAKPQFDLNAYLDTLRNVAPMDSTGEKMAQKGAAEATVQAPGSSVSASDTDEQSPVHATKPQ